MGNIFFKSTQHKERFVTTMQRLDCGNFNVAITSLIVRRTGYRVEQEG